MNCTPQQEPMLPLAEDFYTIQGEGFHTGKPAYFIRIGGCDVGCRWCDSKEAWNAKRFPQVPESVVVERAAAYPAKAVVVTGGEPLGYNLDSFCAKLKQRNMQTFLETSGSQPLSGQWDWICLSPKREQPPMPSIYERASELKVIVETDDDFVWAEENAARVRPQCLLYLQPEWSRHKLITSAIVEYVKLHPQWNISIQAHKFMNIP